MNNIQQPAIRLLLLFIFLPFTGFTQDPLNRSVQVSMEADPAPLQFNFSWDWDWSDGGYVIYRKSPDDPEWGMPIGELDWGSTSFSDNNVEEGVPYEYAFYKKEFEYINTIIDVPVNETLVLTFENLYGDGICCNFGFGYYEAKVCGDLVANGSQFGLLQSDTFTICDDASGTVPLELTIWPDMQVNNTWWSLNDLTGNQLGSSGLPGTWLADRPKYGYILAGLSLPATEYRGTFLLLVDDVYVQPLATEIAQLVRDLEGDGWHVQQATANRDDEVSEVKSLIASVYESASDLKMVYLLGHIPVPYAGDIYPDGHVENHWGAWAADVYYADIDGVFTDTLVNNTTAQFSYNHNVPGDGKFDQSAIPSKVELALGRVDLFDMPAFGMDDIELTRRYLEKAHLFKTGQRSVERRALVDDNLNIVLASPAASGWRNFAPMFTADSVQSLDYFSTMRAESYLWSYGCGGGSHQSANGIGTTQDFAQDTLQNIFTMLLGSQFGDWDNTDNFLKAPLASPSWTLTNCWAGNPPYTFHKMAMGEPIGNGLLATQNATASDYYPGPALVHTALMGDPSLRLHPVKMPSNLTFSTTTESVELAWEAPENETLIGYYIYRADSLTTNFQRLNDQPVSVTNYVDQLPPDGLHRYMIRAVKMEESGSGTYLNLSLGIMDTVSFRYISGIDGQVTDQMVRVFPNPVSADVQLEFPDVWGLVQLEMRNAKGQLIHTEKARGAAAIDCSSLLSGVYFIKILNERGDFLSGKKIIRP